MVPSYEPPPKKVQEYWSYDFYTLSVSLQQG